MVVGLELNIKNVQQLNDAPKEQSVQQSPGEQEQFPLAKQKQSKDESDCKQLDDTTTTQSTRQSPGGQEKVNAAKQGQTKDETNGKLANTILTNWYKLSCIGEGTMTGSLPRFQARPRMKQLRL